MKQFTFLLALLVVALPSSASVILGFAGVESGVPIAGQEDIVIYNFTGPTYGCSNANMTPVCTSVTLDDAVVYVNGSAVSLGDIAPGQTESLSVPNGVFASGTTVSLAFSATLSATTLLDASGATLYVNPLVYIAMLPVDGTLGNIVATSAAAPEPSFTPVFLLLAASGFFAYRKHKQA